MTGRYHRVPLRQPTTVRREGPRTERDPIGHAGQIREFLGQVVARHSLADFVRDTGVRLRRSGRHLRGPCPIHNGVNPNFVVTPSTNLYYCHVCQRGGSVIDFLLDCPKVSATRLPEALQIMSDRSGVPVPAYRGANPELIRAIAAEVAYQRDVLDFARRFFIAARERRAPEFMTACHAMGLAPDRALAAAAGYAPPGHRLAHNIKREVAPEAWRAFKHLGLVMYQGPAGSAEAAESMVDVLPPGVIFPVADRTRLAGFAAFDMRGTRVAVTHPGRGFDPRAGVLCTAADTDRIDGPGDGPPAGVTLWRSPAQYFSAPPLASEARRDTATEVPRPLVPVWEWDSPADVLRVRRQLRGSVPVGVLSEPAESAFWAQAHVLEFVDAVADIARVSASSEHPLSEDELTLRPSALCHPLELIARGGDASGLTSTAAAIADAGLRMVVLGWVTQQGGGARASNC